MKLTRYMKSSELKRRDQDDYWMPILRDKKFVKDNSLHDWHKVEMTITKAVKK